MSYRHQGEQERADGKRSSPSVVRLFGQMMMLPFTVFAYGIELFAEMILRLQRTADQGIDLMVGEAAQPAAPVETGESQSSNTAVSTRWSALNDQATTLTNDVNVGDANEVIDKETQMSDKDLSDDQLKLVRYKILFVKRDYETAFPEREELVSDNMTGEAYTAWKIAEFIQRLDREELPEKWRKKGYPRKYADGDKKDGKYYIGKLDDENDKKYLRVYFEVLERYVREEDEDDEVDVLREIRDAIKALPGGTGTGTGTGTGGGAGTGSGAGTGTGSGGSAGGGTGF
ncbi:MAG: hypothetical protein H7Z16_03075 [Pyrinomonadaceae bacterium]|nr:hypothetical protein [Pyrinomonadaceae bacterium]